MSKTKIIPFYNSTISYKPSEVQNKLEDYKIKVKIGYDKDMFHWNFDFKGRALTDSFRHIVYCMHQLCQKDYNSDIFYVYCNEDTLDRLLNFQLPETKP